MSKSMLVYPVAATGAVSRAIRTDASSSPINQRLNAESGRMFQSGQPFKFDTVAPQLINGRS